MRPHFSQAWAGHLEAGSPAGKAERLPLREITEPDPQHRDAEQQGEGGARREVHDSRQI